MSEQKNRQVKPPVDKPQGIIARTLSWVFGLAGALLVVIALSAVIEVVGIEAHWWPADHASALLVRERSYLEMIDRVPLTALTPVASFNNVEWHFDGATADVHQSARHRQGNDPLSVYVLAAINTVKLLLLRLVVCLFSLPGYAVVAVAALIDGGVQRDIRKYTGAHESSYLFHGAKRWILPGIMGTVSLYLMSPWSIYPALAFVPSMALFGYMLFVVSGRFKKYI